MNAFARVLAPLLATLSASYAFGDVRPIPGNGNGGPVVVPVPTPGHGPGYPHPGPGYPPGYPQPGSGYPPPPPGYPGGHQPYPETEIIQCQDFRGGYDFVNFQSVHGRRADYRADVSALGVYGNGLRAYISNRINDTMLVQIQTPFGLAQMTFGYLSHPYGPTAVLSLGGQYQEFRCRRSVRPQPAPRHPSYPPSPYPPAPYPFPHR